MANEIKAKQDTSLALFGDDVSKGFENMTQEDMALPFVRILGQLSPQVTDGDAKYIEGAKPGMIYNTVTSELYDGKKGIKVIPCYYKKDYPEWSDRGDGPGAPVAIHLPNSPVIATGKRDGSKVSVKKEFRCTLPKDEAKREQAYQWLRDNKLEDIIKNNVFVTFGRGEDDKAQSLIDLAAENGFEPQQKSDVAWATLTALFKERVEAGLDMPSEVFNTWIKDKTKISRKK